MRNPRNQRLTLAGVAVLAFCSNTLAQVELPALPYAQDALEPYISAEVGLPVLIPRPLAIPDPLLSDPVSDVCSTKSSGVVYVHMFLGELESLPFNNSGMHPGSGTRTLDPHLASLVGVCMSRESRWQYKNNGAVSCREPAPSKVFRAVSDFEGN